MKYLCLIFLAFLAQMLGGCATESVMRIGDRSEDVIEDKGYQAAYADENTLVVRYQTNLSQEKWASIPIGSFKYVPMALLNQEAIDEALHQLDTIECSAPHTKPRKALPPQIPLYQHNRISDMKNDRAPVSAYASPPSFLILLRYNSTHPGEVGVKAIGAEPCQSLTPWAPYVRAVLLPFSIAIDIIGSPLFAFALFAVGDAPWG